jgi:hypothetical protein
MRTRLLAVLLAASAGAFGADRDFDRLVKEVESRFGVQPADIPLMRVANLFVKAARPEGAEGFKLAIFEDLKLTGDEDGAALDRMMADASGGLRPLVRTRSRRDHEWTYIYTGEAGKSAKMLIATFERNEATIVEVDLNRDALLRLMANPARAGDRFGQ